MLSKRSLGCDEVKVTPNKRFRLNAADLFLSNSISASRTAGLFADAVAAGAQDVQDLSNVGSAKNMHRNLLRKLLKRTQWPDLYVVEIPIWDKVRAEERVAAVPLLLPHEIVAALYASRRGDGPFFSRESLDAVGRQHLDNFARDIAFDGPLLGLGLWQDGVAAKWDRSKSFDMLTMSFPGLGGRWASLRIPLVSIDHVWVLKERTWDALLEVVAWSFRSLALGVFPATRHDGAEWLSADVRRKKLCGVAVGCRGALCQMTGDWKAYKEIFRVPQFNERAGCCFKCRVLPSGIRDTGAAAPWRQDRLDHWQFLARLAEQGKTASPLFGAPGFRLPILRLDWLHIADLGVAADWLGQLFWYLLRSLPGANDRARCDFLWRRIQELYREYPPFARLDNLTLSMFVGTRRKSAKLRCHASECRGLVPVARHLAGEILGVDDPVDEAVRQATFELAACYRAVERSQPTATFSRRFATLWVALEDQDPAHFHSKPKLHLFQELCEMEPQGRPVTHATYREEEFGGNVAALGRRLGGHNTPSSVGVQTLLKFRARHQLPAIGDEGA